MEQDLLKFSARADIEKVVVAFYHVYDANNPEHRALQATLQDYLAFLMQYPNNGLFTKTALEKAWHTLDGDTLQPAVVTIQESAQDTDLEQLWLSAKPYQVTSQKPSSLKGMVKPLNQVRQFLSRSDHAMINFTAFLGESARKMHHSSREIEVPIGVLTCALPSLRLAMLAYDVITYMAACAATKEEKALSSVERFQDQIKRHWPELLHNITWFFVRLCSCFLYPQYVVPLSFGLFSFGLLKTGMVSLLEDQRYVTLIEKMESGVEQQALLTLKQNVSRQGNIDIAVWFCYFVGATISQIGSGYTQAALLSDMVGSVVIALTCIGHIVWEQKKPNLFALASPVVTQSRAETVATPVPEISLSDSSSGRDLSPRSALSS